MPMELGLWRVDGRFGMAPPEEINASHRLTVVAGDLDPATERIIKYLATYEVPIDVALFRYFPDGDRAYLARTWLLTGTEAADPPVRPSRDAKEPWNGQDWYVTFGEEAGGRSWTDARRYGFVSAGVASGTAARCGRSRKAAGSSSMSPRPATSGRRARTRRAVLSRRGSKRRRGRRGTGRCWRRRPCRPG
jgi:hypothetical protein